MTKTTICFNYFFCIWLILSQTVSIANAQTPVISPAHLSKLNAAIEANPNSAKTIKAFLHEVKNDSTIEKHYRKWMMRFPKAHTLPFTIGDWYMGYQNPRAKNYLLNALAIKPDLAEAWYLLSLDATRGGDQQASRQYLEKAIKADNNNAGYAFEYAFTFKRSDDTKYQRLTLEAIRRFADSEKGAQALYWLAQESKDLNEQLMYYELLYGRYINKRSPWLEEGMNAYYVLLLDINPAKALDLATNMFLNLKQNWGHWPRKIEVAKQYREAQTLLNENNPAEALEILNRVDLGSPVSADYIAAQKQLLLYKANVADQAGHTRAAYDSLAYLYSKQPEDSLGKAMLRFGKKLGKDTAQVFEDIWHLRDSMSVKATIFNLKGYVKDENVSLADFKGKIVLVTYWFPGCAPCRREFPHIESVLKKVNKDDLVYLGVNIIREQDEYVIPYLSKSGYSFIPLKDEPFKDKGTLRIGGAPTSFLIDQEGNIIFKNFIIGEDNENMLELMINELSDRKRN